MAIADSWGAVEAEDGAAFGEAGSVDDFVGGAAVGDGDAGEDREFVFIVVEAEAAMWVVLVALAVDDGGVDDCGNVGVGAADGNPFSVEFDVAISRALINTLGEDNDAFFFLGGVDGVLDGGFGSVDAV